MICENNASRSSSQSKNLNRSRSSNYVQSDERGIRRDERVCDTQDDDAMGMALMCQKVSIVDIIESLIDRVAGGNTYAPSNRF